MARSVALVVLCSLLLCSCALGSRPMRGTPRQLHSEAISTAVSLGGKASSLSDAKGNSKVTTATISMKGGDAHAQQSAQSGRHDKTVIAYGNTTISEHHDPPTVKWEDAPACPFKPTANNSVEDSSHRLWGFYHNASCAFKSQRVYFACPSSLPRSSAVEDKAGHLWGWYNNASCVFLASSKDSNHSRSLLVDATTPTKTSTTVLPSGVKCQLVTGPDATSATFSQLKCDDAVNGSSIAISSFNAPPAPNVPVNTPSSPAATPDNSVAPPPADDSTGAANTPAATNIPAATNAPAATNNPAATNTPAATNNPAATNTPAATNSSPAPDASLESSPAPGTLLETPDASPAPETSLDSSTAAQDAPTEAPDSTAAEDTTHLPVDNAAHMPTVEHVAPVNDTGVDTALHNTVNRFGAKWETAPLCKGSASKETAVQDTWGRLWWFEDGMSCAYRKEDGTSLYYEGYTPVKWETAAACKDAPSLINAMADAEGRLWGWMDANNCKFVDADGKSVKQETLLANVIRLAASVSDELKP